MWPLFVWISDIDPFTGLLKSLYGNTAADAAFAVVGIAIATVLTPMRLSVTVVDAALAVAVKSMTLFVRPLSTADIDCD